MDDRDDTFVVYRAFRASANGKRANSGFKKEAWEHVGREVQAVYIGFYAIPLQKVKQKEDAFKGYYKGWKLLREQFGFG